MNSNVVVFKQTADMYNSDYRNDTRELCKDKTVVYKDRDFIAPVKFNSCNNNIKVISGDTVETGKSFVDSEANKITAILNFADALTPGGLVLSGASTQEEHICRCSNLYASLTSIIATEYYAINERSMHKPKMQSIYTNTVIYSKDVLFFRSAKDYEFLENPYHMDVITCPAPSARLHFDDAYLIMLPRVECIIKSAIMNGVNNLILGAWGCGAFGQNPRVVAQCFKEVLNKYPAFDNVIFAIRSCGANYRKKSTSNFLVFKEILG